MIRTLALATAALALTGCSSMPRQTGTSYACNGGTKLNVNYAGSTAIVRSRGRPLDRRTLCLYPHTLSAS